MPGSGKSPKAPRPRRRFGQNFLHDPAVVAGIVASLHLRPYDRVVEIGPGLGAITVPMLEFLGNLDVVEIDRDLNAPLQRRCRGLGTLTVHQADALSFDFSQLDDRPASLRVVGNLPYNISSPLLFRLLDFADLVRDMHFMLQREVVERLAALPGTKAYGRLSVMIQQRCSVVPLMEVPPESFRPQPKVHSAFVRLEPRRQPALDRSRIPRFGEIVRQAFSQRRKKLRNALGGLLSPAVYENAGIDPDRRPDSLAVDEFVALARADAPEGLHDTSRAGAAERDG